MLTMSFSIHGSMDQLDNTALWLVSFLYFTCIHLVSGWPMCDSTRILQIYTTEMCLLSGISDYFTTAEYVYLTKTHSVRSSPPPYSDSKTTLLKKKPQSKGLFVFNLLQKWEGHLSDYESGLFCTHCTCVCVSMLAFYQVWLHNTGDFLKSLLFKL